MKHWRQIPVNLSSAARMCLLAPAVLVVLTTVLYVSPKLPGAPALEPQQNTPGAVSNRQPADFVLTNGKIYTEDSFHQTVEALVVRDGKIIFTGTNADAMNFIGPKTQVEDAGGRLVLPGL